MQVEIFLAGRILLKILQNTLDLQYGALDESKLGGDDALNLLLCQLKAADTSAYLGDDVVVQSGPINTHLERLLRLRIT